MGAVTTLTPRDDIITSDRILLQTFGAMALANDYTASYEEIVRKQLWVRIAVNKLSYAIGRLPLKTYRRTANGRERVEDSPLAELIRRPNESKETGHPSGFKARVAYDLFTYGNAIILKIQTRPDVVPDQLIPFSPRHWSIDENGDYVYRVPMTGEEKRYKPWRVIHLMEPGPSSGGFGVSRLEAARLTLSIEYAAQRLGAATFENGARPGGIINVKDTKLQKEAIQRFKDEVRTRFGGVDKAGLPAVLQGDVTWTPISHNLSDSAVIEHRQLTRMEVAALYDIPQPAIGILDEANFASTDALHLMFYQDGLTWPLKLTEDALSAQLIDGVPEFDGLFVEFDLNAVMRGAFAQRMQGYQVGINSRIFTPDEVRSWENLPPMADEQPEAGKLQFPLNYSVSPESAGRSPNGAIP